MQGIFAHGVLTIVGNMVTCSCNL